MGTDVGSAVAGDGARGVAVAVVGGGPIGLAAAIEARLAGFDVTVIEPRDGAIDKACGEGLMPGAVPLLERLGVHPEGHPLTGVSYRAKGRSVEHLFRSGPGLGVRRTTLQTALHSRAVDLGVGFVSGRVLGLEQDASGVSLSLDAGSAIRSSVPSIAPSPAPSPAPSIVRAEWVLACDGLHSTMRRLTGLDAAPGRSLFRWPGSERPGSSSRPGSRRRFGLRRHVAIAPWSSLIEVHWTPRAEIYITPVSDDTVGVALLGPRGTDFDAEIANVPELASRLAGHAAASTLRGAGPFDQRSKARVAGRVLLVGDASGYVDAITGEGLRLGFGQATAAVAAVGRADAASYEREWLRVTRDFRVLTSGLVRAATSPLRGAIVPTAAALPGVFGAVVERLAR